MLSCVIIVFTGFLYCTASILAYLQINNHILYTISIVNWVYYVLELYTPYRLYLLLARTKRLCFIYKLQVEGLLTIRTLVVGDGSINYVSWPMSMAPLNYLVQHVSALSLLQYIWVFLLPKSPIFYPWHIYCILLLLRCCTYCYH